MPANAGQLLVNRQHFTVPLFDPEVPGANGIIDIDTGLQQENRSYGNDSVGEPIDGAPGNLDPGLGPVVVPDASVVSRVMVIPMAPLGEWATITHGEPYFNTITGTVHVQFFNTVLPRQPARTINAEFWMPHSIVGPVEAETYNPVE